MASCLGKPSISPATKVMLSIEDNVADGRLADEALAAVGGQAHLAVVENAVQAFENLASRGRFAGVSEPDLILLDLSVAGQRRVPGAGRDPFARAVEAHSGLGVHLVGAAE